MLAYFGTDQSQVQRYLTGKSIGQSRLSLLFNAMAKVPMQFFILFIGTMVFVFFLFVQPPLLFHPVEMERVRAEPPNTRRWKRATIRRSNSAKTRRVILRMRAIAPIAPQPSRISRRAEQS